MNTNEFQKTKMMIYKIIDNVEKTIDIHIYGLFLLDRVNKSSRINQSI